ncbi:MAG TPA: dihydrofolate reductase [Actinotalea sp.]|nr:dihydrofolate reductase [Actinotalea sp.]
MIWAQSADGVIGVDGALPWHLPEDLAHFRALTAGHPVVMGHATWRSLPPRFRPLPGRENIVLSRTPGLALPGARVVPDVDAALAAVAGRRAWVIGGAQVYEAFLAVADRLEVTEVDVVVGAGTSAPALGGDWHPVARDPADGWAVSTTGLRYRFVRLERRPSPAVDPGTAVPGPGVER